MPRAFVTPKKKKKKKRKEKEKEKTNPHTKMAGGWGG